ncbi:PREDICTED: lysoplasmalogenase-like protein TMEM86A isoform X2 [Nicrophorus vespilloides]|uniref:lysoplasmalogenase n=1 Tax=Nicrophorus vespilloides TaxID=110193 RepID=A0ABM1MVK8_NICVS|nr:PREDICTED: lysoplasmalogenase-like protein TMEM86A isoform X2 [Nicrophorus vespilloides]
MITVILKLVPFFAAIILYFSVFIPHTEPTYLAALIKCLPIITLMIFVVWYSKFSNVRVQAYGRRIFFGLLFSCIGDYCLIWPDYFPLGMLSFAIGHINYITAFGFSTRNLPVAVVTYTITALGCLYLMPGLTGILIPGVPIYSIILNTMMWRAVSRMNNGKPITSTKILTAIGAVCFVVSDLIIGLDRFKFKIPYDQELIMSTYYVAQFGIALSILDEGANDRND